MQKYDPFNFDGIAGFAKIGQCVRGGQLETVSTDRKTTYHNFLF